MLFSHNIPTPLPPPEFLVNNAVPPGQAIKLDWLDRRPSALARDQVPKRHLSATPHSLGSRALPSRRPEAQGRGTIGDDVRDATNRVPILWFQETDPHPTPRQRFHIDVQVPYDVAEQRIAAAVAAGAVIVDDSRAPSTTVIADPDGNKACVGTFQPPPQPA